MITIILFLEEDGGTPFRDWFGQLPLKAKLRCRARLQLLAHNGHLLRRPAADYLRHGIYELRAKSGRVQYRMLYFFRGREVVVVSHGLTKQLAAVPPNEIERALARKAAYTRNPARHSDSIQEPL